MLQWCDKNIGWALLIKLTVWFVSNCVARYVARRLSRKPGTLNCSTNRSRSESDYHWQVSEYVKVLLPLYRLPNTLLSSLYSTIATLYSICETTSTASLVYTHHSEGYQPWLSQQHAVAVQTAASAQLKPNAHVASNQPWIVIVRRRPPKTPWPGLVALAVWPCLFLPIISLTPIPQELVLPANVLVIVLRPKTRSRRGPLAPAVRDLMVCVTASNLSRSLLILLPLQGSCTCEKAADGGTLPEEIDFTTKAWSRLALNELTGGRWVGWRCRGLSLHKSAPLVFSS